MSNSWNDQLEWLETDGLGGFASGTVGGIRTRRYHGLLLSATAPPAGRVMLVNGVEALVTMPAGTFALSSQRYAGQVVHPEGFRFVESFTTEPWPTWRFRLPDGTAIVQEIFARHGSPAVAMSWRLEGQRGTTRLLVRPLLSGRDFHGLHRENAAFNFHAEQTPHWIRWRPYDSLPAIVASTAGRYEHAPLWYRNFCYQEEWLRGFDAVEDLASPGAFHFNLSDNGEATIVFHAEHDRSDHPRRTFEHLRGAELKRRRQFLTPMLRAADQYLVRRGDAGKTVIAGYPWFGDWGRDSFIALRGLCLATGRLDDAREILLSWADFVSDGMLPNRFPDHGQDGEYNSVDASLWYAIAVFEFLAAEQRINRFSRREDRQKLLAAVEAILLGYAKGTRFGIRLDDDGLLSAGQPGMQLTWMDAKIGDWVVTPRIGKPVEIQALWLNVLTLACEHSPQWQAILDKGRASFRNRFWNEQGGYLFDVVDVDHVKGTADASFRPNQILAVGGLPMTLLDRREARAVVEQVEKRLLAPAGLRSLAPHERGYTPRYTGGPHERDAAYHQGTVWPWLIGPFVEAWVRTQGPCDAVKLEARRRFLDPIIKHIQSEGGLGHASEILDAETPHQPRGCPFQAWSLAEVLRLDLDVLAIHEPLAKLEQPALHPTAG